VAFAPATFFGEGQPDPKVPYANNQFIDTRELPAYRRADRGRI